MKKHRIITMIACLFASEIIFTSCDAPVDNSLTDADRQQLKEMTARVQESWN